MSVLGKRWFRVRKRTTLTQFEEKPPFTYYSTWVNQLDFLCDNEAGELISDFSMQFLNSVYIFKNASRAFDRETSVEKALSTVELRDREPRIDYRFVDSKDSICVQLSDLIARLFGKHFSYLHDNTLARLNPQ